MGSSRTEPCSGPCPWASVPGSWAGWVFPAHLSLFGEIMNTQAPSKVQCALVGAGGGSSTTTDVYLPASWLLPASVGDLCC